MSVALLFPPLVSSGFGSYYPSLAVLSGTLKLAGHSVNQIDLNERLAEYLLEPGQLERLACGEFYSGTFGRLSPDDMPCVAARLLGLNRAMLFTPEGRHRFSEHDSTPAYLLQVLTQPYVYDARLSETLDTLELKGPLVSWYASFFDDVLLQNEADPATRLVGISVPMGPQLLPALLLAQHIRGLFPPARILLGGPTMSLMQDDAIVELLQRCTFIDAVARYDGEHPLRALADQVQAGDWQPADVPGVSSLQPSGPVHRAPAPGPSLDTLPMADYDPGLVNCLSNPEFGLVQTRGCYWGRCAYCDFVELYEGSPRYRGRSPKSFVDEIEAQIERHAVRRFSLITEAIPPSFSLRFSNLVIERGLEIEWNSFAMVDRHFSAHHFELMARAGCDHLVIGLETMTDRVLKNVHKYSTGADNEAFLRRASEAGIALYVNLIPNLPTTTFREAMESLDWLVAIEHTLGGVAIFPFEATRSSRIGRDPGSYGLEVLDTGSSKGQAVFADNHLSIADPGMTEEELHSVLRAYQAFADRVNARTGRRFASVTRPSEIPVATTLTVADRDVDIFVGEQELRCFNWKTRERWAAPRGLKMILDRARSFGGAFTALDLIGGAASHSEFAYLIDLMVDKGIFEPAADTRSTR